MAGKLSIYVLSERLNMIEVRYVIYLTTLLYILFECNYRFKTKIGLNIFYKRNWYNLLYPDDMNKGILLPRVLLLQHLFNLKTNKI